MGTVILISLHHQRQEGRDKVREDFNFQKIAQFIEQFLAANSLLRHVNKSRNPKPRERFGILCLFGINYLFVVLVGVMPQGLLIRHSCHAFPCGTEQFHQRVHRGYRPYPYQHCYRGCA